MAFEYPEIEALNTIYVNHKVTTKTERGELLGGKDYYPLVHVQLGGFAFDLFVDDEYDDLRKNYPLLNLCLVLRELEGYALADDYLVWCQERFFDPGDERIRSNYTRLGEVYGTVESILGNIDSHVSDFDFEMNAGAAQRLRKDP